MPGGWDGENHRKEVTQMDEDKSALEMVIEMLFDFIFPNDPK
jgi:hypothetical protein